MLTLMELAVAGMTLYYLIAVLFRMSNEIATSVRKRRPGGRE